MAGSSVGNRASGYPTNRAPAPDARPFAWMCHYQAPTSTHRPRKARPGLNEQPGRTLVSGAGQGQGPPTPGQVWLQVGRGSAPSPSYRPGPGLLVRACMPLGQSRPGDYGGEGTQDTAQARRGGPHPAISTVTAAKSGHSRAWRCYTAHWRPNPKANEQPCHATTGPQAKRAPLSQAASGNFQGTSAPGAVSQPPACQC